jgi:hypothetical protein
MLVTEPTWAFIGNARGDLVPRWGVFRTAMRTSRGTSRGDLIGSRWGYLRGEGRARLEWVLRPKERMPIVQRILRTPLFWIAVAAVAAVVILVFTVGGGSGGGGVGY